MVGGPTIISGARFTGTKSVKFGTTSARFTVLSSTRILAVAPRLKRGSYKVTVTTGAGTNPLTKAPSYTYFGL